MTTTATLPTSNQTPAGNPAVTLQMRCCWHLYRWPTETNRLDLADWVRHEGRRLIARDHDGYLFWSMPEREVRAENIALRLHRLVLLATENQWADAKLGIEACRFLAPWDEKGPTPESSIAWAHSHGAEAYRLNLTDSYDFYGENPIMRRGPSKERPGGGFYTPPPSPTFRFDDETATGIALNEYRRLMGFLGLQLTLHEKGGDPTWQNRTAARAASPRAV